MPNLLPKVSVLVPIYGVERYIGKCAESLLGQDYPNIEYIFVDDCTPDKSIDQLQRIVARHPRRQTAVHILHNAKNRGLAATRNIALRAATGEYIMHIDSDDYLTADDAISKAMETARNEEADIVLFDMLHVFPDKQAAGKQRCCNRPHEQARRIIRREASACVCGGIYRRTLYTQHDIQAVEGLDMGEDYATKPRLFYHARKISHLPLPLYGYTHLNDNSYTRTFKEKSVANLTDAMKILTDFFEHTPEAETFRQALHVGHLRTKARAVLSWGVADSNDATFRAIRSIRSPYSLPATGVPLQERWLLWLYRKNCRRTIRLYSRTGLRIKQWLK